MIKSSSRGSLNLEIALFIMLLLAGVAVGLTMLASGVVGSYNSSDNQVQRGSSSVPVLPDALGAVPGDTSVALSWDPATGDATVIGYTVIYGTTPSYGSTMTSDVPGATVSNLANGRHYYFRVQAYSDAGKTSNWISAEATTTIP
jgi:hypothetical protein